MTRAAAVAVLVSLCLGTAARAAEPPKPRRPNVLVILTDDQGHGDLSCHGNPKLRTPHLDKLAGQSVQLTRFCVSPVCAPTRASLLTGRWNYRTGVVDTFLGRALLHPDEVTLAEMLRDAGYRTGIFGKWHLGDNYPLRAQDQGFQEVLVHRGGGIGQPSDPPGGGSYFDPVLQHNGKEEKAKGYCSDVFTDAALRFIGDNQDRPFFCYLAFNCPHAPLQVPDAYYQRYKNMNLAASEFPAVGHPLPAKLPLDDTAKVYGMVANIDDNLGRLFAKLDELKLAEDTVVVFLTDNGPQQPRWNSGLRERKGSVHEGGIRVPCFVRWPARLKGGWQLDVHAAHVDLAPTLLEACAVAAPARAALDGKSLLPLLRQDKVDWPDRTLFFQWHRGDEPELYRACAARSARWKLVQPLGANGGKLPEKPPLLLFDMTKDPLEEHDVAAEHPDVVAALRRDYEAWFQDVGKTRGYGPLRIHLGAPEENPTTLTRQDWRGPRAGWAANDLGYWEVQVARGGAFDVTVQFAAVKGTATIGLAMQDMTEKADVADGATQHTFAGVRLAAGPGRLEATVAQGGQTAGVQYLEVKRRD